MPQVPRGAYSYQSAPLGKAAYDAISWLPGYIEGNEERRVPELGVQTDFWARFNMFDYQIILY
jgi:hypothetical protein